MMLPVHRAGPPSCPMTHFMIEIPSCPCAASAGCRDCVPLPARREDDPQRLPPLLFIPAAPGRGPRPVCFAGGLQRGPRGAWPRSELRALRLRSTASFVGPGPPCFVGWPEILSVISAGVRGVCPGQLGSCGRPWSSYASQRDAQRPAGKRALDVCQFPLPLHPA